MIKETRQSKICLYRQVHLKEAPNYSDYLATASVKQHLLDFQAPCWKISIYLSISHSLPKNYFCPWYQDNLIKNFWLAAINLLSLFSQSEKIPPFNPFFLSSMCLISIQKILNKTVFKKSLYCTLVSFFSVMLILQHQLSFNKAGPVLPTWEW